MLYVFVITYSIFLLGEKKVIGKNNIEQLTTILGKNNSRDRSIAGRPWDYLECPSLWTYSHLSHEHRSLQEDLD